LRLHLLRRHRRDVSHQTEDEQHSRHSYRITDFQWSVSSVLCLEIQLQPCAERVGVLNCIQK
jgi:hypothetical protein